MTTSYEYYGSRCTRDGGYWELVRDASGRALVTIELIKCLDHGTAAEQKARRGELLDLMERAKAGTLVWKDDVVGPLGSHSHLLELRWDLGAWDNEAAPILFRLYFAEPLAVPRLLLGLLFHRKRIHGLTEAQIRAAQQVKIDEAEVRRIAWLRGPA